MTTRESSIDADIARALLATRFEDEDGVALARLLTRETGREAALSQALEFDRVGARLARACMAAANAFRAAVERD